MTNWGSSDLHSFRELKSIVDVHAEVADGALDLRVTEQNLSDTYVAGRLVVNDLVNVCCGVINSKAL